MGPQIWPQKFPIASAGKKQSPIDLNATTCVVVKGDQGVHVENGLKVEYPKQFPELTVQNTGYGWKVDIPDDIGRQTRVSGGPLSHVYRLTQFHCHWGKDLNVGSEHTVNGKSYAAELHFVHWNTELFSSPADAMPSNNGLTVLGVFLDIGNERNEELEKLLQNICLVKYKGEKCKIAHNVDVTKLFPDNKSYYTYPGSLTTPPLWESVTWIVYSTPILCTADQIAKFRDMCYVTRDQSLIGGELLENYRLPQPINDRTVTFVTL
ncbi:unnamed protein product [Medioppia subpectinata]|uniref:Carbonic anhydrase n=1 Tax=Medioppia subpectinata TaxID=1979941 RepID=A0A7R9KSS9_9ACAR|nr:unnamed protein product [Medioppia subpectinata]CAG2108863.1 unnamed protein product [Medioppia subpectinata]